MMPMKKTGIAIQNVPMFATLLRLRTIKTAELNKKSIPMTRKVVADMIISP